MNIGNTKKHRTKHFSESLPKTKSGGIIRSTLRGYLFSLAIGTVMTILLSAVVYSLSDPNRYITPVAFCILYISALLGGFFSARFNRGSALLCGGLYALMMLATMFLISLLFSNNFSSDLSLLPAIGLRGIAAALSIVGAMVGTHQPSKKRKRK